MANMHGLLEMARDLIKPHSEAALAESMLAEITEDLAARYEGVLQIGHFVREFYRSRGLLWYVDEVSDGKLRRCIPWHERRRIITIGRDEESQRLYMRMGDASNRAIAEKYSSKYNSQGLRISVQ